MDRLQYLRLKRVQNYLSILFVFLGYFFCFCAFAWSEGKGGRDGGREGGGFFLGQHKFPLDFPQENVPYLKENVRYLGFPRKTTVFLTFWTDFVPFRTFS